MSADIALPQHQVLNSTMAYREAGRHGAAVALFLHGNPTSSYIWRNIIPQVEPIAHCIAPDLIGFGQSGKPDIPYRFDDHVRYLDAFIAGAGITSAYLVAQDWGTGLAFHLAARRPQFVRGLAFMEFIRPVPTWDEFLQIPAARELFRKFRTPGAGEKLILEDNAFVERVLPGSVIRKLSDEEMAVYRAPFPTPQSRRPILRFPNEIPIAGEPADVYATFEAAHAALARSTYPKLLFAATRRIGSSGFCRAVCGISEQLPSCLSRRGRTLPAGRSSRDDRPRRRRVDRPGRGGVGGARAATKSGVTKRGKTQ
jgi:haloalkane dehalogenase